MQITAALIAIATAQPLTFQPHTAEQVAQANAVFDDVTTQLVASFDDDSNEKSLIASLDALNDLGPEYTESLAHNLMTMEGSLKIDQLATELNAIAPDIDFGDSEANIAESMKILENMPEEDMLELSQQMTESIEFIIGMTMDDLDKLSTEDFMSLVEKIKSV